MWLSNSSVGRKVVMSVTGIALVLFLTFHMAMNLSLIHIFKMYLPIVDLRMVTLITDAEDKLIAVGISMPSLSEALQKSHGRLLPLSLIHICIYQRLPNTPVLCNP